MRKIEWLTVKIETITDQGKLNSITRRNGMAGNILVAAERVTFRTPVRTHTQWETISSHVDMAQAEKSLIRFAKKHGLNRG